VSREIHDAEFEATEPKPIESLAKREPLEMEGHTFSEEDIRYW
jgi:hypothetical protein